MHMETDPTLIASFLIWLRKLLTTLALPPFGPLAVLLLGMLCLRWRRTPGRLLIAMGLVLSVAFTSPLTVGWMLRPLEATPPLALDTPPDADAIIILGGGKQRFAPEYDDEALNHSSLERARYGAHVARHTDLPVLVTGGRLSGTHSEAELLREALENDWNIPVRWSEDAARNTLPLRLLAKGVTPILAVVSVMLLWRGHNEPGGGFIAALVASCAFALVYLSRESDSPVSKPSTPVTLIGGGLMLAGLTGVGGYALGQFLEPAHWYILGQHITSALLFDLGVFAGVLGLVMTTFNTLGSGGSPAGAVPSSDETVPDGPTADGPDHGPSTGGTTGEGDTAEAAR